MKIKKYNVGYGIVRKSSKGLRVVAAKMKRFPGYSLWTEVKPKNRKYRKK